MGFGKGKYQNIVAAAAKLRPGEPFFLLRGQDVLAPAAIDAYALMLESSAATVEVLDGNTGAPELRKGAADCMAFANEVRAWQVEHADLVKLPD